MKQEIEQGLRLIEQRRPQEAYQIFDEITRREANCGIGYYGLARVSNLLGDFSMALKLHKFAVEVSPDLAYSLRLSNSDDHQDLYSPPYEEEIIDCPVCGSSIASPISVVNLSTRRNLYGILNPIRVWVRCQSCGHIYANPRPTEQIVARLHEIFELEQKASEDFNKDVERFLNDYNAHIQKSHVLQTIARIVPPEGDFLEVGFGTCLSTALA